MGRRAGACRQSLNRLEAWLLAPVDNTALVLFRILFGVMMAIEAIKLLRSGWVREAFVVPHFTFTFPGFQWLRPLQNVAGGHLMEAWFVAVVALGVLVAFGLWFRVVAPVLAALWAVQHALQLTNYNNHHYLMALLALLLAATPAHRALSLDSRRNTAIKSDSCPRWCLLAFAAQTSVVYIFASLAKLDTDWLEARPLRLWLANKTDYRWVGPIYEFEWLPHAMAYGGVLFDALIVPALLWRRTRILAVLAATGFHLFNATTFGLGVFPYLALGLSVFFFPASTLRRALPRRHRQPRIPAPTPHHGRRDRLALAALALYFAAQVALPLRHHLIAGDVTWTEEGHHLSWRMMLRTKSGRVRFSILEPSTGRLWTVTDRELMEEGLLSERQFRTAGGHPDRVWQLAQFLAQRYEAEAGAPVEVRAHTQAKLNGRQAHPIVEAGVDLAAQPWRVLQHNPWVLPRPE